MRNVSWTDVVNIVLNRVQWGVCGIMYSGKFQQTLAHCRDVWAKLWLLPPALLLQELPYLPSNPVIPLWARRRLRLRQKDGNLAVVSFATIVSGVWWLARENLQNDHSEGPHVALLGWFDSFTAMSAASLLFEWSPVEGSPAEEPLVEEFLVEDF